jgi:hypothetical protein
MKRRDQALRQARHWERLAVKHRDRKHVGGRYRRKANLIRQQYGYDTGELYVQVAKSFVDAWKKCSVAMDLLAKSLILVGAKMADSLPTMSLGVVGAFDDCDSVTVNAGDFGDAE